MISTAWPLADAALTQEILDLLQSSIHLHQAKKGANEGTFALTVDPAGLVTAGTCLPLRDALFHRVANEISSDQGP